MLFNSFNFLIFFPIVCIIFFLLKGNTNRNAFLLVASYYFYMNWNPIYAILILGSTIITYFCGLLLEHTKNKKKLFLTLSLIINFSILFVFKYFNFINESIWTVMDSVGIKWDVPNLDLLLPVGISFYTFQAVGYTIDVYRGTIKAENNFIVYALFVSFFPQLVAGPIERAKNLLPQFYKEHELSFNNFSEGFKQMLWGFFMKLCVADRLSEYVDAVYNNVDSHNGSTLLVATLFFTFQIYCDFAGYSNIAIGAARIMDFRLMTNFNRPYFSVSIKNFWRRWHISLSSWFSDYVYIPLGGNRVKYFRHLFNLFVTFLISGIWHGANWTFVMWGFMHGIFVICDNIIRKYFLMLKTNGIVKFVCTAVTFLLVMFAWIFFRANSMEDAVLVIYKIFTSHGPLFVNIIVMLYGMLSLLILLLKEVKDEFCWKIDFMHSKYQIISFLSIIGLITYIMQFAAFNGGQFIYFQF